MRASAAWTIVEAMPDDKLLALIGDRGGNGACGGMSECVPV